MNPKRTAFLFLNLGHLYDHLFMLLYPTVVIALESAFNLSYGSLIALSTPGFIAFGAGALPAGWLGDKWSRRGMMTVFFIGIGLASILTGLARSPIEIAVGLTLIGLFASIYHPIGIAMVAGTSERVGRALGINGVWGNMGVAFAALFAGALTDLVSWRAAFIVPGVLSIATGFAYMSFLSRMPGAADTHPTRKKATVALDRAGLIRVLVVMAIVVLLGGLIFNAMTVVLPKLFDERLGGVTDTLFGIGGLAMVIYAFAAFAQIVVGNLLDRYPLKPIFLIVVVLQFPVLLLMASMAGPLLLLVSLGTMALVFGEIPINDMLIARYTSDEWRSRAYSLKYVLGLGVSAVTVPFIAYTHSSGGGFATLFIVLAGVAVLVAAAVAMLPSSRAERPAAREPAAAGVSGIGVSTRPR